MNVLKYKLAKKLMESFIQSLPPDARHNRVTELFNNFCARTEHEIRYRRIMRHRFTPESKEGKGND